MKLGSEPRRGSCGRAASLKLIRGCLGSRDLSGSSQPAVEAQDGPGAPSPAPGGGDPGGGDPGVERPFQAEREREERCVHWANERDPTRPPCLLGAASSVGDECSQQAALGGQAGQAVGPAAGAHAGPPGSKAAGFHKRRQEAQMPPAVADTALFNQTAPDQHLIRASLVSDDPRTECSPSRLTPDTGRVTTWRMGVRPGHGSSARRVHPSGSPAGGSLGPLPLPWGSRQGHTFALHPQDGGAPGGATFT